MPTLMQWIRRPTFSLRSKLVILLSAVVCLILAGQTVFWLATEVTDLDSRIAAQGTIAAQGIANSCATILDGSDPHRFDSLVERIERSMDLVELTITDRFGAVLAQRQQAVAPGTATPRFDVFNAPRPRPGLRAMFDTGMVYSTSAPVVRGTLVIGFVGLRFRSSDMTTKSLHLIFVAFAMALFWLLVAGALGGVYVARITRPLGRLTDAARLVTAGQLSDVVLPPARSGDEVAELEASFSHLVTALRAEQAENAKLLENQQQLNARLRQRVDEVSVDLRETASYLQSVIRAMEQGVITCDGHGEIVEVNPGAARHLAGFERPVAGMALADLLPNGAPLADLVADVVLTGKSRSLDLERIATTAPADETIDAAALGGKRTLAFRAYPIHGAGKRAVGVVLIVTDETHARLTEVRMRRQDRLISLGTIAAGLAHELGNYMHAINGFASLLLRDTPTDDARRPDLQAIRDENQRAIALLERFLQFARPRSTHFSGESLEHVVREAVSMCAYRLRAEQVDLQVDVACVNQDVRCDGGLLVQVCINLILNAIDALAGRPERWLRIVGVAERDGMVGLRFSDSGSGVAPEHLERIFDPFFTTKTATGTGLGLSIAHKIVEAHGGTLTVESTPGHGTTFVIALPVAGPKEETP